jgi:hypothetical protein
MKCPYIGDQGQQGILYRIPFAGAHVSKNLVVDPAVRKQPRGILLLRHHHRLILKIFPGMVTVEYHRAAVGFNGINDIRDIPL